MKIAGMIHAYQNPELVIHLINTILKENDTVWLHYDKKSPQKEFLFIQNTFKNNPNVYCYSKIDVWWDTYDSVKVNMILSEALLQSTKEFDYVIHLTGTIYPIKPIVRLKQFLLAHQGKSFLNTEPNAPLSEIETQSESAEYYFAQSHFGSKRYNPKFAFKSNKFCTWGFIALYRIFKYFQYIIDPMQQVKLPQAFLNI